MRRIVRNYSITEWNEWSPADNSQLLVIRHTTRQQPHSTSADWAARNNPGLSCFLAHSHFLLTHHDQVLVIVNCKLSVILYCLLASLATFLSSRQVALQSFFQVVKKSQKYLALSDWTFVISLKWQEIRTHWYLILPDYSKRLITSLKLW